MTDNFVEFLKKIYPRGNPKLEVELRRLKHRLNSQSVINDFSSNTGLNSMEFNESDDELLCKAMDEFEQDNLETNRITENQTMNECDEQMFCDALTASEQKHVEIKQKSFKCLMCSKVYKTKKLPTTTYEIPLCFI